MLTTTVTTIASSTTTPTLPNRQHRACSRFLPGPGSVGVRGSRPLSSTKKDGGVRCGVGGAAWVGVGRGAVAARWRALSMCRGRRWGIGMISRVLTAVRSDRDRLVWREGVAVVAGRGGSATGGLG